MKKMRIGNIEFDGEDSICKYLENKDYGKLGDYLDDGWRDDGECITSKDGTCHMDKSLFYLPELKYVIADVLFDEDGFSLRSIGTRLVDVTLDEFKSIKHIVGCLKTELDEPVF